MIKLPRPLVKALEVMARAETERQGLKITAADLACSAIDFAIGMHIARFPHLADAIAEARELTPEQTEAMKTELAIEQGKVLAQQ